MIPPVIVAGTGRSGTSVVARLCEELGVEMGGPSRQPRSNPVGDYERMDIKEVNEAFSAGEITAQQHRDGLLYVADEQDGPWGFKHPKCAEFFANIVSIFPKAHIIWCQRDYADTLKSYLRWFAKGDEALCRATIGRRLAGLNAAIGRRRNILKIDMTNRWDEDDLKDILESYLNERGVL